jgi:hypothetical protein
MDLTRSLILFSSSKEFLSQADMFGRVALRVSVERYCPSSGTIDFSFITIQERSISKTIFGFMVFFIFCSF